MAEVDIGKSFGFGPNITSLGKGTALLVNPVFSFATFAVIIYFLLGAFKYLKAGGNKEDVESAKQMIIHAIIGFMVLMFAFLILQFVLGNLFKGVEFQIIK